MTSEFHQDMPKSREGSGKQQFEEQENFKMTKMDLEEIENLKSHMTSKQIEEPIYDDGPVIPESRMASPRAMQTI